MGGYSGYCSASLCQRDYNNRYYFYYLRPVMIFWVQLCCKSRNGKYWKITVIEDYRAQCNFEWLQHCFYATFENHGPTKGCGIPALHLEWEKSIHQSSSKMSWTEYSCCYLQIPKEFKEDWKMTIKWWQFSLDQWGISIPPMFVYALSVDKRWAFDLLNPLASLLYSLIPLFLLLAHQPLPV